MGTSPWPGAHIPSRALTKLSCCDAGFNSTEGQGQRPSRRLSANPSFSEGMAVGRGEHLQESLLVATATVAFWRAVPVHRRPRGLAPVPTQSRSAHGLKEQGTQGWESESLDFSARPPRPPRPPAPHRAALHPSLPVGRWHPAWLGVL